MVINPVRYRQKVDSKVAIRIKRETWQSLTSV